MLPSVVGISLPKMFVLAEKACWGLFARVF
jgi:hypothetical protein